ncbi:MAG: hypothetical protein LUQ38_07605, partial [Methanotrichaceae archaeon]|nr:hypothetical protein [Methanotrichaceae archaeon]
GQTLHGSFCHIFLFCKSMFKKCHNIYAFTRVVDHDPPSFAYRHLELSLFGGVLMIWSWNCLGGPHAAHDVVIQER